MRMKSDLLNLFTVSAVVATAFLSFATNLYADQEPAHQEELTNIIIHADPRAPSLLENTAAVSVMQKEKIKQKAETSIGETLQLQPGVSSSYFGPASSRPVIRGNAGERVRILRNGIGSFDISNTSEDHQVTINPLNARSIEVLRGPETLLYGSSAIGGVVNIVDDAIAEKPIGREFTGELDMRGETADQELSSAGKFEGQIGKFNWHLSGLYQDTGNIDIPGFAESEKLRDQEAAEGEEDPESQVKGVLPSSFSRTSTQTAGGSYVWEKGFWGVSFTNYDSHYGIPGHEHSEDQEGDESHDHEEEEDSASPLIDLKQWRIDSRGAVQDVSDTIDQIKFRLGGSRYKHSEIEGATTGTEFDNDAYEGRVEAFHNRLSGFKGIVGTQFEANDFSATGEEAFVPGYRRYVPALFVFEEYALTQSLDFLVGGRYEYSSINAIGYAAREFQPISGSVGLSLSLDQLKKYVTGVTFAYTQRAPSGVELYADGIHAARQIYEVGDPNLGKESSVGVDVTFKKNHGLVTGAVNLFAQHYDDYINLTPTGAVIEGFDVYDYSPIRAQFAGFEVENTLHIHELTDLGPHHFDLGTQLDYVKARNESGDDNIPRIPPFRGILRGAYDWNERFFAELESVFVAAQTHTAEGELGTDAYQLFNLNMRYQLEKKKEGGLTLYARALNLTNEKARIHSSFIKDIAPLPGISFVFGIGMSF